MLAHLYTPPLTISQWLRASLVTKLACMTDTVSANVAKGSKSSVKSWPVIQPTITTKGLQGTKMQQHQAQPLSQNHAHVSTAPHSASSTVKCGRGWFAHAIHLLPAADRAAQIGSCREAVPWPHASAVLLVWAHVMTRHSHRKDSYLNGGPHSHS